MIAAVFSEAVGDSQEEGTKEGSVQKKNVFPVKNSTSPNEDLLTERGTGLDKSFQTSNFQTFMTELDKAELSSNS